MDTRAAADAPVAPTPSRIEGDPTFVKTANDFMKNWLQKRKFRKTGKLFTQVCLPCVNQYREQGRPTVSTWTEAGSSIESGLEEISDALGKAREVGDVVNPVELSHADVRIVNHREEDAYVLAGLPDYIGSQLICTGEEIEVGDRPAGNLNFGNYYAIAFQPDVPGGEAGTLYLIWRKEGSEWRIVAFHLVEP